MPLSDLHFVRPYWFWALPPLALLVGWLWFGRRRRPWQRLCDPALLPALLTNGDQRPDRRPLLLAAGWLLAVIALAGPSWQRLPPLVADGPARVLVLDLSRSMAAADRSPSRLAQARFELLDLLRHSGHGQVGLVVYAGDAFTVCPLTEDTRTIAALLPVLDSSLMPLPGTRTDLALERAGRLFEQADARSGQVILVTDSATPEGPALAAAERLRRNGYRLSVLAVGTLAGAPIPAAGGDFLHHAGGQPVISRRQDDALRRLAAAGGGQFAVAGERPATALLVSEPPPTSTPVRIARALGLQADRWLDRGPWLTLLLVPLAALGARRGWLGLALLAVLLPALPSAPASAAEARLDRDRMTQDETLHLTISVRGNYRGTPDLAALRQDFEVLEVNRSARVNQVNGGLQTGTVWLLTLAPLRSGQLLIPPIEAGGESTPVLPLRVDPAPGAADDPPDGGIQIELAVEPGSVLVHQQAVLTMRILHRLPLLDARVDAPRVGDARLLPLGRDRAYRIERDGRRYRVLERRWALFASRAGTLAVAPMTLEVRIDDGRRTGPTAGGGRTLRRRSNAVQLRVEPVPADAPPQDWLPAARVELDSTWQPSPARFEVGVPVTRTVVLRATGLPGELLPDLAPFAKLANDPRWRLYPDQATSDDRSDGDWIIGQRSYRAVLIPRTAGAAELPAVDLPWWRTTQGIERRSAQLPAQRVEVRPATGTGGDSGSATGTGTSTGQSPADGLSGRSMVPPAFDPWRAFFGLGWALTLLLLVRERRRNATPKRARHPRLRQARAMLRRACRDHDPAKARQALLAWARLAWPDAAPQNLAVLAERLPSGPAREAVLNLDRVLYKDPTGWRSGDDRSTLQQLVRHLPDRTPNPPVTPRLPALYPSP